MARFFIDRPVFAWVIALVIMLAGALAIRTLPIRSGTTACEALCGRHRNTTSLSRITVAASYSSTARAIC